MFGRKLFSSNGTIETVLPDAGSVKGVVHLHSLETLVWLSVYEYVAQNVYATYKLSFEITKFDSNVGVIFSQSSMLFKSLKVFKPDKRYIVFYWFNRNQLALPCFRWVQNW